ncbi:hypothetical protein N7470_007733 [Penicillium chermesinum]|nr:hypothetical protein N7470_007733 [Penicillium chermesinum]
MRKVKCDEEKNRVQGLAEPQCKRCKSARIRCEWKGGPIPRKRTGTSSPISQKPRSKSQQLNHDGGNEYDWKSPNVEPHDVQGDGALLSPLQRIDTEQPSVCLEAANSLKITAVDRECIDYLRTSTLVIVLGKHWPWSTVSYAYHKIAVTQPMVMSMILASTAREIHRLRVSDDQCFLSDSSAYEPFELSGQAHYGQALWALRQALKEDVKSPQDIEAIFITLWLIIDYENRFGGGEPAIHIHIRGIETMFHNHVAPLLHSIPHSPGSSIVLPSPTSASLQLQMPEDRISEDIDWVSLEDPYLTRTANLSPAQISLDGLSSTSVPLFLLWTLYFFTPFRTCIWSRYLGSGHGYLPILSRSWKPHQRPSNSI